jgi:hypothetical protein
MSKETRITNYRTTRRSRNMRNGYISGGVVTILLAIAAPSIVYVTAAVTTAYNKHKDKHYD